MAPARVSAASPLAPLRSYLSLSRSLPLLVLVVLSLALPPAAALCPSQCSHVGYKFDDLFGGGAPYVLAVHDADDRLTCQRACALSKNSVFFFTISDDLPNCLCLDTCDPEVHKFVQSDVDTDTVGITAGSCGAASSCTSKLAGSCTPTSCNGTSICSPSRSGHSCCCTGDTPVPDTDPTMPNSVLGCNPLPLPV